MMVLASVSLDKILFLPHATQQTTLCLFMLLLRDNIAYHCGWSPESVHFFKSNISYKWLSKRLAVEAYTTYEGDRVVVYDVSQGFGEHEKTCWAMSLPLLFRGSMFTVVVHGGSRRHHDGRITLRPWSPWWCFVAS